MGKEIERKFLIADDSWRGSAEGISIRQGYLSTARERVVRVRTAGDKGYLTIKGLPRGATRPEYEYEIPVDDARHMLDNLCVGYTIDKIRYKIEYAGLTYEIDEFKGENEGLVIAEVELEAEDQAIEMPPWAGREVTGDPKYFNSSLIDNPYSKW
jgi:adenylate cyclase